MCGISAILLGDPKATTAGIELHESIYYLQHRGQDAAGITVCQGGRLYQMKGNGLASKVFQEPARIPETLPGYAGISHVRYPTAGTSSASEAQPFYVNSPFGLSLAVNGNLVNSTELRSFLDLEAHRHVNTDSDSELLLNVYAHALHELGKARANVDDIFAGLREVYSRCKGGFACVAMITGFGVLGFRDENGIRPLCLGSRPSATLDGTMDYFMASESVALTQLGFTNIVDILPGQAVFIQKGGHPQFRQIVEMKSYTPDIFEMVYFSRPDSSQDGISIYRSRQNMGERLAERVKDVLGEKGVQEIDVVIPIPETSNTSAAALASRLQKPLSNAFVRNRYTFRTFIMPGQKARQQGIRRKLSPIASEFKDKVVLLVDDSIVRGNTSREIVLMSREAGAKKVILASCSPEITHPHVYGIDLADPAQLVAHNRTVKEIAKEIGADELIYQSLDDLKAACLDAIDGETQIKDFEVGVFCGKYQTDVPESYFEHLSEIRAKGKKRKNVEEEGSDAKKLTLVSNSGPVNVRKVQEEEEDNKPVIDQDDISLHNSATER
ncbi:amidophosphoribosyltransferase [Fusarium solani]|nr:amidophosphoribosyltransferase [Fusarium solani]